MEKPGYFQIVDQVMFIPESQQTVFLNGILHAHLDYCNVTTEKSRNPYSDHTQPGYSFRKDVAWENGYDFYTRNNKAV